MKNTALIITHLVPETNVAELQASARIFKTINLTASFDEHCTSHLVDEDETPEIVRPGVATLFVSFTIWDSQDAVDTFRKKLQLVSDINIDQYLFAQWESPVGEMPVLNEAFGRIWFKQHLEISPAGQTMLFPELLKSFGRRWLLDILGPTEDAFIYDRWEVKNPPVQKSEQPGKLSPLEAHEMLTKASNKLQLSKKPFGDDLPKIDTDKVPADEKKLTQEKIRNFNQLFSGYNIELNNWRVAFVTLNYARLANLANWAERILGMISNQITIQGGDCPSELKELMKTEERKWRDALDLFTSQRDLQFKLETKQNEVSNEIFKKSFNEQAKRNTLVLETGNELLSMHADTIANAKKTSDKNFERWKQAFLPSY